MIAVTERWPAIPDEELFARGRLTERDLAYRRLRRFGLRVLFGDHGRRNLAVGLAKTCEDVLLDDVSDHDDRGVVRSVVGPVELDTVFGAEGLDVRHPSDRRPVVGV